MRTCGMNNCVKIRGSKLRAHKAKHQRMRARGDYHAIKELEDEISIAGAGCLFRKFVCTTFCKCFGILLPILRKALRTFLIPSVQSVCTTSFATPLPFVLGSFVLGIHTVLCSNFFSISVLFEWFLFVLPPRFWPSPFVLLDAYLLPGFTTTTTTPPCGGDLEPLRNGYLHLRP